MRKRQAVRVDSLPFYFCQLLLLADSAAISLAIALWKRGYSSIVLIRIGRCRHLRRSIRTSVSVDADICAGRCGHLRRSTRMTNSAVTLFVTKQQ